MIEDDQVEGHTHTPRGGLKKIERRVGSRRSGLYSDRRVRARSVVDTPQRRKGGSPRRSYGRDRRDPLGTKGPEGFDLPWNQTPLLTGVSPNDIRAAGGIPTVEERSSWRDAFRKVDPTLAKALRIQRDMIEDDHFANLSPRLPTARRAAQWLRRWFGLGPMRKNL